jgi:hypothetical protein
MTSQVHAFDPREGGSFRISLTYDARTGTGKTTAHTDTYHGRFVKLVTNEQVREVVEFETTDPALHSPRSSRAARASATLQPPPLETAPPPRPLVAVNPGIAFCYVSGEGTDSTERGRSIRRLNSCAVGNTTCTIGSPR